ncbi:hypothetical protein GCM10011499_28940 [Pelagibacterium lentulum]|uniref:Methyl-accepting chemotaxis sensory transducer with Cache sensor n=2 Tax=Pelagibacterium lentulum TaxID=2029865 RepID=A0A916RGM5_9HYPH|nr:hypothetical protein GCM10011499_28940 [Pelagibacterium lentulum]
MGIFGVVAMHLNISGRIYLLVALSFLAIGVLAFLSVRDVTNTRTDMRQTELVSIVQSAQALAAAQYERAQAGEVTEAQAQAEALDRIRDIRYRGNEYLFVFEESGLMLMHPINAAMEGGDHSGLQDSNGKYFFAEMIETANAQGGGFVSYMWPRVPNTPDIPKESYVELYEPWGWILGTGVYVDDLAAENFNSAMVQLAIVAVILLVTAGTAVLIARTITRPISKLTTTMDTLSKGDYSHEVEGTARKDEIGLMARAVAIFRENGLKVAQMTEAEAVRVIEEQKARAQMMSELQDAFGNVVDAAVDGDFTKRVETEFPDAELNALASGINNLVEVVDRSIDETGTVLAALAQTDLTKRVSGEYKGALAKLKTDTNAVAENLSGVVTQLRQTSRALKVATGEILAGTNDLSERTTKQAAAIEETSAAMDQLTTTVNENAQKAENAFSGSETAAKLANEGGTVMADATTAMERITTSSSKISNIIGMIDDIAFQTNLLALNASVEAARAGEAGKGFAVVAVEVRRLAQSAAEASSEVKALIEQSANEVDGGSKLVANAAQKLAAILQSVEENSALMKDISRANREQTSAINEVSTAIRQMDEMTQHNAALVEETNAAIEQTEAQASELDRIVDVFKVSGASEAEPVRQPAPANSSKPSAPAKTRTAASAYLSQGNAALKAEEWDEF